jgi:hypothetical protein
MKLTFNKGPLKGSLLKVIFDLLCSLFGSKVLVDSLTSIVEG